MNGIINEIENSEIWIHDVGSRICQARLLSNDLVVLARNFITKIALNSSDEPERFASHLKLVVQISHTQAKTSLFTIACTSLRERHEGNSRNESRLGAHPYLRKKIGSFTYFT